MATASTPTLPWSGVFNLMKFDHYTEEEEEEEGDNKMCALVHYWITDISKLVYT